MLSIFALCAVIAQLNRPIDPGQKLERTVFQTGANYSDRINLRADVAIVYGFDKGMPARVRAWKSRGYKVHLMTGVAWGEYQDYYFGRWDGLNHEDEAQARSTGEKVGHGKDVYYMSPGKNYGKYLADGVRRALEVGVEAVHLEEPEFWTFGGYGQGFKREWQDYYHEAWQDPAGSPDARWHAAKLMYYLYRRALQQVFDSIQSYNHEHQTHVRCYVPTHSLLNYAQWGIVSPESSLAKIAGCDGYIAQVWTGTAREPNFYRGIKKERTFETAFLEYGSMQNLVRSTGRQVWYLSDPIEDNADHDWNDYRQNYHSTLIASLLQPEVSQYEVMPWPERIFNGTYPSEADRNKRVPIPDAYATELQVVINALKDMKQSKVSWNSGSHGLGVMVSDSLMFERGEGSSSDGEFGHFYGLALPFVKRGMPVQPVQLENVTLPGYLNDLRVVLMTYEGMKPLTPDVHTAIASWVRDGGTLVFVDDDSDPFNAARDWWNRNGMHYKSPREHLFEKLGLANFTGPDASVGKGHVLWLRERPSTLSRKPDGGSYLAGKVRAVPSGMRWKESSALVLNRGPYVIAAGMDESDSPRRTLIGDFVDLFDPELRPKTSVDLTPSTRHFLVNLARTSRTVVAASGYVQQMSSSSSQWQGSIEGISKTRGIILLRVKRKPISASLAGQPLDISDYDGSRHLLWLKFPLTSAPQVISVRF